MVYFLLWKNKSLLIFYGRMNRCRRPTNFSSIPEHEKKKIFQFPPQTFCFVRTIRESWRNLLSPSQRSLRIYTHKRIYQLPTAAALFCCTYRKKKTEGESDSWEIGGSFVTSRHDQSDFGNRRGSKHTGWSLKNLLDAGKKNLEMSERIFDWKKCCVLSNHVG